MESEKKKDNSEISETTKISLPDKICQSSCSICRSDFLQEIHLLKKNGARYTDIGDEIFKKSKGLERPTPSSLCNHFKNYNKIKSAATFQVMQNDLMDGAMKRAAHSSAVVKLIDEYLELLRNKFDSGISNVNIADLEKLMNIKYKLLSGEDEDGKDLTVIFNNAVNRVPTLFDSIEPPIVEISQERKEAERVGETLQT